MAAVFNPTKPRVPAAIVGVPKSVVYSKPPRFAAFPRQKLFNPNRVPAAEPAAAAETYPSLLVDVSMLVAATVLEVAVPDIVLPNPIRFTVVLPPTAFHMASLADVTDHAFKALLKTGLVVIDADPLPRYAI